MIQTSLLRADSTGSGAKKWLNCPASTAMAFGIEEQVSDDSTAGTKAHKEAKEALLKNTPSTQISDDAVKVYVDLVRNVVGSNAIYVETRLDLLGSSGGIDCYSIVGKTGYIFDFKYGVGVELYAEGNEQLAFYAVALREKYPELKIIYAYLIQPRVDDIFKGTPAISLWKLSYQTLVAWRRKFERGLNEVEKAEVLRAGSWCQFCKAKGCCPVYVSYAERVVDEQNGLPGDLIPAIGQIHLPTLVPRIAKILLMRERIQGWWAKAEDFLLPLALRGVEVPGFELRRKRSKRVWHSMMTEAEIAQELSARGLEEPWIKDLITITQAEKSVDLEGLTEKPEGEQTLKPIKET